MTTRATTPISRISDQPKSNSMENPGSVRRRRAPQGMSWWQGPHDRAILFPNGSERQRRPPPPRNHRLGQAVPASLLVLCIGFEKKIKFIGIDVYAQQF